ncbi:MAG: hypothetical protein Q9186_005238 [Xanthomendoza sp. 1 TL-2023]
MGRRAFVAWSGPVNIVRLTPQQYLDFRDKCEDILIPYYAGICTPSEAPEKQDHGNIDIFVCLKRHGIELVSNADLAKALGATHHLLNGPTSSFAIPVPASEVEFFRLDVHISLPYFFEWETTFYTHEDMWHILGMCTIQQEFRVSVTGLHLRIPEIAQKLPNHSLLHLTSDPWELMDFLGLDADRFRHEFQTLNDLFVWATSSRFFERQYFERQTLDSHSRATKRPMYLAFLTDWLPQHPEVGAVSRLHGVDVVKEALTKFDRKEEWRKRMERYESIKIKEAHWNWIAKRLPLQGEELTEAVESLKALLRWRHGAPELVSKGYAYTSDSLPVLDDRTVITVLLPWVAKNWQAALDQHRRNQWQNHAKP